MARAERVRSKSKIYHIMLRGINRQDIFDEERDAKRFLETIRRYKEVSKFEIFAYCIMSNHVHMLIRERVESISDIIKRISSSYVSWYNNRYERCGHLFQERFRSETVETDGYFLTVLRYIHQNPVKAGIVKDIQAYKWSSYREYIGEFEIIDIDFALDMFSNNRKEAIRLFQDFNEIRNNDKCLDDIKTGVSDSKIEEYIRKHSLVDPNELKILEKSKRNEIIKKLKLIDGITIRQLSRITGISKSVIDRI